MRETVTLPTPIELADFFSELRQAGYRLDLRQLAAAERLLLMVHACEPQLEAACLKTLLAPVFVTSPAQQADFYGRFDAWVRRRGGRPVVIEQDARRAGRQPYIDSDIRRERRWRWLLIVGAMGLLLAAGVGIWWFLIQKQEANPADYLTTPQAWIGAVGRSPTAWRKPVSGCSPSPVCRPASGAQRVPPMPWNGCMRSSSGGSTAAQDLPAQVAAKPRPCCRRQRQRPCCSGRCSPPGRSPCARSTAGRPWPPSRPTRSLISPPEPLTSSRRGIRRMRRRSLWLERWASREVPELDRIRLAQQNRWLFSSPGFRFIAQSLRRHRRVPATNLDIRKTIEATVDEAGLFTPVNTVHQLTPEYLFLIEEMAADAGAVSNDVGNCGGAFLNSAARARRTRRVFVPAR